MRGVAQFGSASGLGPEGRQFKSGRPDVKMRNAECEMRNVDSALDIPHSAFDCGSSSMVEPQPSKLMAPVRSRSPAPEIRMRSAECGGKIPHSALRILHLNAFGERP